MNLLFYSMLVALFWGISPIAHKTMMGKLDTKVVFAQFKQLFFFLHTPKSNLIFWAECDFSKVYFPLNILLKLIPEKQKII